jgi:choloylglycine hydrolase
MSKMRAIGLTRRLAAAVSIVALLAGTAAEACTGIELIATDGTVVHARTLEFAIDLKSEIMMIPRGYKRIGSTPDGAPGMQTTAKYASIGMNALGMNILVDGVNEKGLAVGLFYFPGSTQFMDYTPADAGKSMAIWEMGSWLLENFASVEEARAGVADVVIPSVVLGAWGFAPEVHFVVRDTTGKSIVIEVLDGKVKVFDAPLGVITNSPSYDWHMTNLRNYVNFSMSNAPPLQLGSVTLTHMGQGSGMLGMPGDFTPPSRFVRAVAFTQSVPPEPTGEAAVIQAFHILNNFDIPKGAAREHEKDEHGNILADYTIWTSAIDLTKREYYFRTYDNSQIRSVTLADFPLDGPNIVTLPIDGQEQIVPLKP